MNVEKTSAIRAPSWMSRGQRRAFHALLRARHDAGMAVSQTDRDRCADYLGARSRLEVLQTMLARELAKGAFLASERLVLALNRELNTTAQHAARLADKLGLAG